MNERGKERLISLVVLIIVGLLVFNRQNLISLLKKETGMGSLRLVTQQEFMIQRDLADPMDNVYGGSGALAFTEKGTLTAYDQRGQILWSRPMMDEVFITRNQERWLVAEKRKGHVYVFDNQGELLGSSLGNGPLSRVSLQEDNKILLTLKGNHSLVLLSEQMSEQARVVIDKGTIIHHDVSSQDNRLTLLLLDDTSGDLSSSLQSYDLQGALLQVLPLPDLALSALGYGDDLYVVYTDRIRQYTGIKELTAGEFVMPLQHVAAARRIGDILFLTTGSNDPMKGLGELELNAFSLSTQRIEFQNKIRENYDNIDVAGDFIALSYKNMLELYNHRGDLLLRQEQTQPIRKVFLLGEDQLALVFPDRIAIQKIKY